MRLHEEPQSFASKPTLRGSLDSSAGNFSYFVVRPTPDQFERLADDGNAAETCVSRFEARILEYRNHRS